MPHDRNAEHCPAFLKKCCFLAQERSSLVVEGFPVFEDEAADGGVSFVLAKIQRPVAHSSRALNSSSRVFDSGSKEVMASMMSSVVGSLRLSE